MCDHGFIGPCAECDGSGQLPTDVEEHPGLIERRREFAADPVERCMECGKVAQGNVSVRSDGADLAICDACHKALLGEVL